MESAYLTIASLTSKPSRVDGNIVRLQDRIQNATTLSSVSASKAKSVGQVWQDELDKALKEKEDLQAQLAEAQSAAASQDTSSQHISHPGCEGSAESGDPDDGWDLV